MEIEADFWPGQRRELYVSFSTAGLHPGSLTNRLCASRNVSMWRFLWRKREFYGVIWRCFARDKCGNIISGFRKCCDCRESHLLCNLPKALTDKIQECGWARVIRKLCAKHKNASKVFSIGDFVLESLFCAQRLWILNLVLSADT